MFTVEMEIINKNSVNSGFYVPATKDFKKYPRTIEGVQKAIIQLCKNLSNNKVTVSDFNITVYEGKVYYYTQNKKILFKLDKHLNQIL